MDYIDQTTVEDVIKGLAPSVTEEEMGYYNQFSNLERAYCFRSENGQ